MHLICSKRSPLARGDADRQKGKKTNNNKKNENG